MGSINRRDLKAYVRYDGSGRVVPGSLILRRNKPKVGTWQQVQGYECNSGGTQYQLSLLTEDTCSATVTYRSGVDNSNQTIELVDLNADDYVIFCAVSGSVNVTDLFCDYDLAEIGQCGCSGEASPITFSGNTTTTTTTTATPTTTTTTTTAEPTTTTTTTSSTSTTTSTSTSTTTTTTTATPTTTTTTTEPR